jgi:hypothetical protein
MLIDEQGDFIPLTGPTHQDRDADDEDADYDGADSDDDNASDQQDDLPPNSPTSQFKNPRSNDLSAALLNGFQLDAGSAIIARGGFLSQVRLSDGATLRSKQHAYAPSVDCQAIQIGAEPGFVCGAETQATTLYRYDGQFALSELLHFNTPRKVQAAGEGGVVIHGSCDESAAGSQGTYCTFDGHQTKQIQIASNASSHVALLRDHAFILLQPPTVKSAGSITRIQGSRHSQRIALNLGTASDATTALVKTGVWLDPLTEDSSGNLFTWVLGNGQFVGVKIDAQGKLQAGELRDDPSRALLNAAVGASLTASGVGFFTTDHGFHWHSFELPAALGSLDPYSESSAIHNSEPWGCSPMGCALGSWLRVGFGSPQTALTPATQPQLVPPLGQAAPHWAMDCAATGEVRGGLTAHRPDRHPSQPQVKIGSDSSALIESSPWRFFQSIAPPAHAPNDLLLDIGQEDRETQFRAYAFGPQTDAWSSSAHWLVRVTNHFDLDSPWSTAATRTPWPQAAAAARVFGQESQASAFTDWSAVLDSSGLAALLRINGSNGSELYILEKDKPILPVTVPSNFDPRRPVTLARARGTWFIATEQNGLLSVQRLEGRRSSPFARFPLFNQDATQVELVESQALDALSIWVKTAEDGWYFYPLDLNSATLQVPTHISVADLNAVPESCAAESEGWRVTSDVPLAGLGGSAVNTWLAFAPDLSQLRVNRVEARVLASEHGVCLDAVAARLDDSTILPRHIPRQEDVTSKPVPVTLTDRTTERRFGFRCGR